MLSCSITAGAYLNELSRKLLECGEIDAADAIEIAAELIDPKKELTDSQIRNFVQGVESVRDVDGRVEWGTALAALIRDA